MILFSVQYFWNTLPFLEDFVSHNVVDYMYHLLRYYKIAGLHYNFYCDLEGICWHLSQWLYNYILLPHIYIMQNNLYVNFCPFWPELKTKLDYGQISMGTKYILSVLWVKTGTSKRCS